jgi:multidrug transporter EmrE-like cation transporter
LISVAPGEVRVSDPAKRRQAALIVLACTLMVGAAQVLIKLGANRLGDAGLMSTLVGILTIPQLFAGYFLYGIFAVLLIYALRHGELSVLYPLIALGYVWVSILSVLVFHESMNAMKIAGVAIIIAGVAVLGWGSRN